jgi:hypothetical protein
LSPKALKFEFEILRNGERICDGYITQVAIDRNKWKAVNIPEGILSKINEIL